MKPANLECPVAMVCGSLDWQIRKTDGRWFIEVEGSVVCTVITMGSSNPGGSGPGNRSGGTGAMPTLPPRVPSSLNSELAGTVIDTPASAGLFEDH